MELQDNIRTRMRDKGMRAADLARAVGVSPQRLNNYMKPVEVGGRNPNPLMLVKIAKALDTTTDALLGSGAQTASRLQPILERIFELEGIDPERAGSITTIAIEALRLSASLEDDADESLRSRIAAQAVWRQHKKKPSQ